jgi:MinD-like ATPase involved in chromosome partitioning or flagellar assembly
VTIRIATIAYNHDAEVAVASEVSERLDIELVMRCVDRAEVLAVIRGGDIDTLLCVGIPHWLDAHLMDEARRAEVRVLGLATDPLEAEMLRVLGGVLLEPGSGLDTVLVQRQGPPVAPPPVPQASSGRVIAVWGPKGAPGRTTVAIELAAELAATEPRTILVDGDVYGGDIAQMLAIVEELPTIVWAAQRASTDELSQVILEENLRRVDRSGPVVLPGVPRADVWSEISEFGWKRLLQTLGGLFSYVVCDVAFCVEQPASGPASRDRDAVARSTVTNADRVVAVCRADPVGIKSFLWAMEDLKELVDLDNVLVVANRVRTGEEQEVGYVLKKHLGKRPRVVFRDRPSDLAAAVASGTPIRDLKPSSEIAIATRDLAAALGADVPARGFLSKLGGRR